MKEIVKDDAESLLGRASDTAHQVIDSAKDTAQPAANWLGNQLEGATAAKDKYIGGSSQYISKHPLKTVAVAVVAGFVISKLFG